MNHTEQKTKTEKLKKLIQIYKEHTLVEQIISEDVVLINKDYDYEGDDK